MHLFYFDSLVILDSSDIFDSFENLDSFDILDSLEILDSSVFCDVVVNVIFNFNRQSGDVPNARGGTASVVSGRAEVSAAFSRWSLHQRPFRLHIPAGGE